MTELTSFHTPTGIGEEKNTESIPELSVKDSGIVPEWKSEATRSVKNNTENALLIGDSTDQTWNDLIQRWDSYQDKAKKNHYWKNDPALAKEERAKIRPVHQALRSLEREYDPENRRFSTSLWGFGTARYRKNTNMEFSNYWGGKRKTRKRRKKKRKKTRTKSKKRKKTKKRRKTKRCKTRR